MVVEYPGSSTYEMKINDILINYTEDITKFNKKVKDLKGIKKRIKNNESKKKKINL